MKQNVSKTESNWRFRKNVKTCLQNKKSYLMPPSRHDYFHSILIFPVKTVELPQQHANTTVHWSSILNVVEFLDPPLKTSPCTKNSAASCENQSFLLLFRNVATFIEYRCVFLYYFLQYYEVFLISLLDVCYHYILSLWIQSMVVQSRNYL